MARTASVYIRSDGNRRLFAIRVEQVATLTALGFQDENYHARLLQRQIDWLTCLINSRDERLTYDLRIISVPQPELYARGQLTIALFCCLEGFTQAQAQDWAIERLRLCETFFEDEYEFALVSSSEELDRLLRPFDIGAAAEITRRTELSALDTLPHGPRKMPAGFARLPALLPAESEKRVYHVYPYILNSGQPLRLFKLLLMQCEPLAISFRLRPTSLNEGEGAFLHQQIYRCERYAQVSIREAGENLEAIHPTLQEQARTLQRRFMCALATLKDNAALLRVDIVGERSVPQTVVDVLGAQLTQPAGGLGASENLETYLSGGYEFDYVVGQALTRAAEAFARLDLMIEPDPIAPPAAERLRYLFDSEQAAAAFRFPAPTLEETPGLKLKTSRTQMAPATIPDTGHFIGHSLHNGQAYPVRFSRDDRRRHVYAVGQTGTGKTTMFESMILADIRAGEGLCVIDPHGDLIEKLFGKIPKERAEDVVILDPGDLERPIGLNALEYESEAQKYFLVQEIIAIIERLLEQWDPAMGGPVFYQHTRMGLLLVMSNPEEPGTLIQFYHIFNSRDFYKRFLPLDSRDPMLEKFVSESLSRIDYGRQSSDGGSFGSYISSKFEGFVSDPMLRNIFGQSRSTINLREIMDSGKILLVNLSKGRLGEINSRFFGMVLIAKLQAAAMARAAIPIKQRRDFYLYVDEFQNLATLNFGMLLSEARKYRLNLILTNQYVSQVDQRITNAIAGNVGTVISFRVGALDAEYLEHEFAPVFSRYDLTNLPNFSTCVSTLIGGQVSRPFSMNIILDQTPANDERGRAIRQLSRLKYGRARTEVEAEIAASLCDAPVPQSLE